MRKKGSDVNIASHLIIYAYEKKFDVAILISSDADYADAIKLLIQKKGSIVKILSPFDKMNRKLIDVTGGVRKIRSLVIKNSQFEDVLYDDNGIFYKPKNWQ